MPNIGKQEIVLTKEQKACVNYSDKSNLVINGIAGSGKSLVLVERALNTAKKHMEEVPKILLLTYTNSLDRYSVESIRNKIREKQEFEGCDRFITVSTMRNVLSDLYRSLLRVPWCGEEQSDKLRDDIINRIIEECYPDNKNRFLQKESRDFLIDEIVWIIERIDKLKNKQGYIDCTRTGRGRSIQPSRDVDRPLIYDISKEFMVRQQKSPSTREYLEFWALSAIHNISEDKKYDYIYIDECQDFGLMELKLVRALTRKSITLCGDMNQKIYRRSFSWADTGIEIRGKGSKQLKGNKRNTKQTQFLADSLMRYSVTRQERPDEFVEATLLERDGELPTVFICDGIFQQNDCIAKKAKELMEENPNATIGILYRGHTSVNFKTNRKTNEQDGIIGALKHNSVRFEIVKKGDTMITNPGVKLCTIHSAKGLEFTFVIIAHFDHGYIPFIKRDIKDPELIKEAMELERNILYVAMTRSRNDLYITCTKPSGNKPMSEFFSQLDQEAFRIMYYK